MLCGARLPVRRQLPGQAEAAQLGAPALVHEQVAGFQVAVQHARAVQVLRQNGLSAGEYCPLPNTLLSMPMLSIPNVHIGCLLHAIKPFARRARIQASQSGRLQVEMQWGLHVNALLAWLVQYRSAPQGLPPAPCCHQRGQKTCPCRGTAAIRGPAAHLQRHHHVPGEVVDGVLWQRAILVQHALQAAPHAVLQHEPQVPARLIPGTTPPVPRQTIAWLMPQATLPNITWVGKV